MRDYMKTVLNGLKQHIEGIKGADVPSALPNPHTLHLTGAVEATYDGSEAVEVVIPQGGGEKPWVQIADIELTETAKAIQIPTLPNGEAYEISELVIWGTAIGEGSSDRGLNIYNNGTLLTQMTNAVAKAGTSLKERRFYGNLVLENGLSRCLYCLYTSSSQQVAGQASSVKLTAKEYEGKMTSISVEIGTTADTLAVGTWFKIWGR